jgi:hypothetical protein
MVQYNPVCIVILKSIFMLIGMNHYLIVQQQHTISHLIYIDDFHELQDISTFPTTDYYDIFIGHTNRFNNSR